MRGRFCQALGCTWQRLQSSSENPYHTSLLKRLFSAEAADTMASSSLSSSDGSIRRTYKSVDVQPHPDQVRDNRTQWSHMLQDIYMQIGFHVLLDKRPLRTPGTKPLLIPSHPLALAIGAEWEWQVREQDTRSSLSAMETSFPERKESASGHDAAHDPRRHCD